MMPRVKLVSPEDSALLAAVEALEAQIFPDPWSLQSICSAVCNPCTKLYAALTEADTLMGYLFVTQVVDTADIANIAVSPGFRRQGIAADLIWYYLAEMKPVEVFLEVRASNADAISLYRHYGFREVGVRKRFYHDPPEDAIVMKRGE